MKMILRSERTIKEVKEEFNKAYPFLQIEFFKDSESDENRQPEEFDPSTELIDVSGVLKEGTIDIEPTNTVKEIEYKFLHLYGLPVRIFRKQNGSWLKTTVTDDLTLQEQNIWGREASKPLKIKVEGHYVWR